jgi:hypothetical protein
MKETLRADFATIPALLAGPSPAPGPSAEEIPVEEIPPPPAADQLDMFG